MVNSSYPDGGSEIKETKPARGKSPEWNEIIEFDVTDRPVRIFFFIVILYLFKNENRGELNSWIKQHTIYSIHYLLVRIS